EHVKLPKMAGVSLGTALRLLLSQLPTPGTYVVRRGFVEVTTGRRKMAEKTGHVYPIGEFGEILSRGGSFQSGQGFVVFEAGEKRFSSWPSTGWKYSRPGRFQTKTLLRGFPPLPALAAFQKTSNNPVPDLWPARWNGKGLREIAGDEISVANPMG